MALTQIHSDGHVYLYPVNGIIYCLTSRICYLTSDISDTVCAILFPLKDVTQNGNIL